MLRLVLVSAVCLSGTSIALAQEWKEFTSREDRFTAYFPGDPVMTKVVWKSEYGAVLEAHLYTGKEGPSTYTLTVVDYSSVEAQLTEKAKKCPAGLERCDGFTQYSGHGYWKQDVRGAMAYAQAKLLKRPNVRVTDFMWSVASAIEVYQLQLLNEVEKTQTHAIFYMHENRLYVLEATVPSNYPAPAMFTLSLRLYYADLVSPQREGVYFHGPRVDPFEKPGVASRPPAASEATR
jgi:hypothetical protein